ncbi:PadR family transcriptional regulator [Candidatus Saccharibacteria bacterium]|nr:MAG: PadR family transcriptional regulator [Candidatus Saccharibacteria bacterium]
MKAKALDTYELQLLTGWEEVYKKGQLTLWILLALKQTPRTMVEIKEFMATHTKGALEADDKSMYRALRRYNEAMLINFVAEPGQGGPDRKRYFLTDTGFAVLQAFLERNVVQTLLKPELRQLIAAKTYGQIDKSAVTPSTVYAETLRTTPPKRRDDHGTFATQDI